MQPLLPAAELLEQLRNLHLLNDEELAELPRLQRQYPDTRFLLHHLLRRGWITAFQARLILSGKAKKLLVGSYVLHEVLGSGGTGRVFKACNWKLQRLVALKIIRPQLMLNPDSVRRFYREVRAFGQFDHPNIVTAYDAADHRGIHYVAMEYVEGEDLAQMVQRLGPPSIADACDWMSQAARGLEHVHQRHLIHRDIKPSNLLYAVRTGTLKITDMGLARLFATSGQDSGTITGMGRLLGTPDFIAPEQIRYAHGVDIRADLYSLGYSLYYLLSGRLPFPGGNTTQKMMCHLSEQPEPLENLRSDIPLPLLELIDRLTQKDPAYRPDSPALVALELQALAHRLRGDPASATHASHGADTLVVPQYVQELPEAGQTLVTEIHPLTTEQPSFTHRHTVPTARNATPVFPRWLLIGMAGVAVCLGMISLISSMRYTPPIITQASLAPTPEIGSDEVSTQWDELRILVLARQLEPAVLRDRLMQFHQHYAGSLYAVRSAQLLNTIHSPLDALSINSIDTRPEWLPAEWVVGWRPDRNGVWHPLLDNAPPTGGIQLIESPHGPVRQLSFDGDSGRLLILRPDATIVRLDPLSQDMIGNPTGPELLEMEDAVLFRDNQSLITSGTMQLRIQDQRQSSRSVWLKLDAPATTIKSLLFTPDRKKLLVVFDHSAPRVQVYDLNHGRMLRELEVGSMPIQAVSVSPNGLLAAVADSTHLRLIDLSTGLPIRSWGHPEEDTIESVTFAANGRMIYSIGAKGALCSWDVSGDSDVQFWPGHNGGARQVVVSADGESIATCGDDGAILIWHTNDAMKRRRMDFPSPAQRVCFSPDSRFLASSHRDGSVHLLSLESRLPRVVPRAATETHFP